MCFHPFFCKGVGGWVGGRGGGGGIPGPENYPPKNKIFH